MAGKIFKYRWQPTTVSGVLEENMTTWTALINGSAILNHIFLRASKSNTLFNFKIISPLSNVIFQRKNIDMELNETPKIAVRGLYSLRIENSQPDDTYEGEFAFEERKDG